MSGLTQRDPTSPLSLKHIISHLARLPGSLQSYCLLEEKEEEKEKKEEEGEEGEKEGEEKRFMARVRLEGYCDEESDWEADDGGDREAVIQVSGGGGDGGGDNDDDDDDDVCGCECR